MNQVIAFAGTMNRIGTTTQAIQFVKMAKENDMSAAYAEVNRSDYLENLKALYSMAKDRKALIEFSGLELYKKAYLSKIPKDKYEFLVKDYGSASEESFEESSFAEQPIKILIAGSKPNEIFYLRKCLNNPAFEDAYFIFTFVPEEERVSILSLMGQRANRTFFSGIITEPYSLDPTTLQNYGRILKMESMRKN